MIDSVQEKVIDSVQEKVIDSVQGKETYDAEQVTEIDVA